MDIIFQHFINHMTPNPKNRLHDLGYQTARSTLPVKMARQRSTEDSNSF